MDRQKIDVAHPLILRTDAFIRMAIKMASPSSCHCTLLYRMFLLGAVGALKMCGMTHQSIAAHLRMYASQLEKEQP